LACAPCPYRCSHRLRPSRRRARTGFNPFKTLSSEDIGNAQNPFGGCINACSMIHGDCHDAFGLIRDTCGFQGEQGFRALGCIHAL